MISCVHRMGLSTVHLGLVLLVGSIRGQSTMNSGYSSTSDMHILLDRLEVLQARMEKMETLYSDMKRKYDTMQTVYYTEKPYQATPSQPFYPASSPAPAVTGKTITTYTRWGRTTCDGTHTTLIYSGYMAGAHYTHTGTGANFVCLTRSPTWEYNRTEGIRGYGFIYGAEYQTNWPFQGHHFASSTVNDQDAPCAVCEAGGRSSSLMVPGTHVCPAGWTQEYQGYLVSTHATYHRAEYVCVDSIPEGHPGGHANTNGALLYYVRARCGALQCPPYIAEREVTCVMCTK